MIYLGTLGRMIGIKCPASQNVEHEERYSFQITLEGRRKAQPRPMGRRTWSLQTSEANTPTDAALIQQFAQGAWGNGPFVFISAEAPHTNLLTPAQASLDPSVLPSSIELLIGGTMQTIDGFAPRSWLNSSPTNLMSLGDNYAPVLSGKPVTASAYLNGPNPRVSLYFYDGSGAMISNHLSPSGAGSYSGNRFAVTVIAPAGAVSCRVRALGSSQAWGPAVTWTDVVQPFSSGRGCEKAVVHGLSADLRLAVIGATYEGIGFTVSEVG